MKKQKFCFYLNSKVVLCQQVWIKNIVLDNKSLRRGIWLRILNNIGNIVQRTDFCMFHHSLRSLLQLLTRLSLSVLPGQLKLEQKGKERTLRSAVHVLILIISSAGKTASHKHSFTLTRQKKNRSSCLCAKSILIPGAEALGIY